MSLVKNAGIGESIITEILREDYLLKQTTFEDVKSGTIYESINLYGSKVTKLRLQLKNVEGDFICRYSKLASVENFPEHITGSLDISFTDIRSKDLLNSGTSPKMRVDGDFVCTGCNLAEDDVRSFCDVGGNIYC